MSASAPIPITLRRHLRAGLAGTLLLAGGVGGWAATTSLAGAVVAPGLVVVDSNVKKVQHPIGGVVDQILVREGAAVEAGDLLVRLDETLPRANLQTLVKSLDELAARRARLEAERDAETQLRFPDDLMQRASDPDVRRLVAGEQTLFELRRAARAGLRAQLDQRISQLREQVRGIDEQIVAKDSEMALIDQELSGVLELWRKNLVQFARVTALQRDAARDRGERGALIAAGAQAKAKITETELQVLQIDQDLRTEVGKELADIRAKSSELGERRVAAEDQLRRIEIRAPQAGHVHQLAVHTVGGVIKAGDPIMLIVPSDDPLTVEVRIRPIDIDQVRDGRDALLRFPAFNQRTTPVLSGRVTDVAADISEDPKNGAPFYTARIALGKDELGRLADFRLVPGMPVEAYIQTGERTVMSFLVKPLSDQIAKAWRER